MPEQMLQDVTLLSTFAAAIDLICMHKGSPASFQKNSGADGRLSTLKDVDNSGKEKLESLSWSWH